MGGIAVIGAGSFGTAMACAARRAGQEVALWAREPEVAEAINAGKGNPFFLPDMPIESGIAATTDLARAVRDAEAVLLVVPSQFFRAVAARMHPLLSPGVPVVSCAKGIERGSCVLMPEILAETLPRSSVAVLAGPSFAREVVAGLPIGVTLACADLAVGEKLARALGTRMFRVYTNDDPISATIGGAVKNVLAIASGIAAGRKLGAGARALIITRGLYEMALLARAKGGSPANLMGLAGIGDLVLTCTGTESRNTSLGIALGKDRRLADILAERKAVTEGVASAESVAELGRRLGIDLAIPAAVDRVLHHGVDIDVAMAELLAHPTGPELFGVL
ncbi:MAG: NAD(P)-dependent glycerol-3-phosphate dehydrogenase [Alphaproteobacteria bacterium]|nr:NAD(P)-dependent glycerol-3-phosphate dehydrogenase [Alphaproteobacteria bacterium]